MEAGPHSWTRTAVKWPNELYCRMDASALAGILIGLWFLFLDFNPHGYRFVPVDLPQTFHARPMRGAAREDALSVGITRDGRIYLGYTQILADDLPGQIREGLKNGAEKKVYVRADARAKYGDVTRAVIEIRRVGIENVCFITENALR